MSVEDTDTPWILTDKYLILLKRIGYFTDTLMARFCTSMKQKISHFLHSIKLQPSSKCMSNIPILCLLEKEKTVRLN